MSYKRFKYFNISKTKKIRFLSTKSASNLCVIFLHGFMSDIEGKKATKFAKYCYKKKVNFLTFEYSGHGKSYGKSKNDRLPLYPRLAARSGGVLCEKLTSVWYILRYIPLALAEIVTYTSLIHVGALEMIRGDMWTERAHRIRLLYAQGQ